MHARMPLPHTLHISILPYSGAVGLAEQMRLRFLLNRAAVEECRTETKLVPSDRAKMRKCTLFLKFLVPSSSTLGILNSRVSEDEQQLNISSRAECSMMNSKLGLFF